MPQIETLVAKVFDVNGVLQVYDAAGKIYQINANRTYTYQDALGMAVYAAVESSRAIQGPDDYWDDNWVD